MPTLNACAPSLETSRWAWPCLLSLLLAAGASGLLAFRAEYESATRAGLLLHPVKTIQWLAPGILAIPWWRVL